MKIINLTPHTVSANGKVFKSEGVARVSATQERTGEYVGGIPIYKTTFGELEGLPEEKKDTIYIVSRIVAAAAPQRKDLVFPSVLVRDDEGRVIGCEGFERI